MSDEAVSRPPPERRYIRPVEVQTFYGFSESTLRRAVGRGEIKLHSRAGVRLVKVADLDAWIEGTTE